LSPSVFPSVPLCPENHFERGDKKGDTTRGLGQRINVLMWRVPRQDENTSTNNPHEKRPALRTHPVADATVRYLTPQLP